MKRTVLTALSAMLLTATVAPATLAHEVSLGSGELPTSPPITPFALASQGYRGLLDGIPGYALFISEYQLGHIEAEDLVQAAITEGRLEPSTLEDEGYLMVVDMHLEALRSNGR